MLRKEIKHPGKLVNTGAYSAAVFADGWVFISGQGPLDLGTGEVVTGSIEEETVLTLNHIKIIVEAAGGSMRDIVKCTVHLANINDFDRFNNTYAGFFEGVLPARTTVQSMLADGIKIEIDAIARIFQEDESTKL